MKVLVFIDHDIICRHFIMSGALSALAGGADLRFVFPDDGGKTDAAASRRPSARHAVRDAADRGRTPTGVALAALRRPAAAAPRRARGRHPPPALAHARLEGGPVADAGRICPGLAGPARDRRAPLRAAAEPSVGGAAGPRAAGRGAASDRARRRLHQRPRARVPHARNSARARHELLGQPVDQARSGRQAGLAAGVGAADRRARRPLPRPRLQPRASLRRSAVRRLSRTAADRPGRVLRGAGHRRAPADHPVCRLERADRRVLSPAGDRPSPRQRKARRYRHCLPPASLGRGRARRRPPRKHRLPARRCRPHHARLPRRVSRGRATAFRCRIIATRTTYCPPSTLWCRRCRRS